ncbi:MAG: phosphotransferase [Phycisphaerales bacterium]|nr:phosphotransferase [Phycisphaerae bacterium]NNF42070.1 phosphotransferase [Phycisphaerales bacterium]NNM25778.1 phosphotransferase [Phycisphaerales bacterium]
MPRREESKPPSPSGRRKRDRFVAPELAKVLSHYDLGVIHRLRPHARGSRQAPKLLISSDRGEFLLKRRAPGRDDPPRVAFAHGLVAHLAAHGYPVPALVPTTNGGSTMLAMRGKVYELFEFVRGERDDRSVEAAGVAGVALGRLHTLLADHEPATRPVAGSYHAANGLDAALQRAASAIRRVEPKASASEISQRCGFLAEAYREATTRAAAGLAVPGPTVIHGDWHPGNLLYERGRIAAVLDFDSARIEPRIIDVANGALQFGMQMRDEKPPEQWPLPLHMERIRALLEGYNRTAWAPITPAELRAVPWLVQEALILESVLPIAATGQFAQLSGDAFLRMVERKVRWLRPRTEKLTAFLADSLED